MSISDLGPKKAKKAKKAVTIPTVDLEFTGIEVELIGPNDPNYTPFNEDEIRRVDLPPEVFDILHSLAYQHHPCVEWKIRHLREQARTQLRMPAEMKVSQAFVEEAVLALFSQRQSIEEIAEKVGRHRKWVEDCIRRRSQARKVQC